MRIAKIKEFWKKFWKRILVVIMIITTGAGVTLNFIPQTPPVNNYHVVLSFTNTGKTYTLGQQVPIKVTVWDDTKNLVSGAKVLVYANGETNTGLFLTTNESGVATYNWTIAQSPGYFDWWLSTGISIGTNLVYAQFVGDATHPSSMDVRHVPINRYASNYQLTVKDAAGNALPEIQDYASGSTTYKMYVTVPGTSTPVPNVAVRLDAPAVYGYCMTDGNGYCSMTVDMEGLRRGANELFFYTKISNTLGGAWSQPVWRTTDPAYVPVSYPRERAQQMWWSPQYYWYSGGVYYDCGIVCSCSEHKRSLQRHRHRPGVHEGLWRVLRWRWKLRSGRPSEYQEQHSIWGQGWRVRLRPAGWRVRDLLRRSLLLQWQFVFRVSG